MKMDCAVRGTQNGRVDTEGLCHSFLRPECVRRDARYSVLGEVK